MNDGVRHGLTALAGVGVPAALLASWLGAADTRYQAFLQDVEPTEVAIASVSEDAYCTPALKGIIRRVAGACGLLGASGGRGCQPMEAKKVAQLSDADFNALFSPLEKRAHIVQFDSDGVTLDAAGQAEVEEAWAEQRGASFFFVVARASPDGSEKHNEALSAARAQAVLGHLENRFHDPELKNQVGLLWLGEKFAQLGEEFCSWNRSRPDACTSKEINRSAFVAWIDCNI